MPSCSVVWQTQIPGLLLQKGQWSSVGNRRGGGARAHGWPAGGHLVGRRLPNVLREAQLGLTPPFLPHRCHSWSSDKGLRFNFAVDLPHLSGFYINEARRH